jgi:small GTP-binding protein
MNFEGTRIFVVDVNKGGKRIAPLFRSGFECTIAPVIMSIAGLPVAKIIMLGDSAVGKTSLIMRYTDDTFSGQFLSTLGFDYRRKNLIANGSPLTLQIWDTAGQEQFRSITKSYMRGADGAALVFDVTSRDSFNRINIWMDSIVDSAARHIDVVLIGNKIDVEDRTVTAEEGKRAADEFEIPYFEVSARTGEYVTEAFESLARRVAPHLDAVLPKVSERSQCC